MTRSKRGSGQRSGSRAPAQRPRSRRERPAKVGSRKSLTTSVEPIHKAVYPWSDEGNAQRFVAMHRATIRYCPPRNVWLVWNGKRWKIDDSNMIEIKARETARYMGSEAFNVPDEDSRKKAVRHALSTQNVHRLRAMVEVARSTPEIVVMPAELDADPLVFNCGNGTVNLKTGRLRPHNCSDLISKIADVHYDPDATSGLWDRYLETATSGNEEVSDFLARCAGYSLTGDTREDVLFLLLGDAAGGKSTFAAAIKATFGDYCTTADFETFLDGGRRSTGPRPELVRLVGTRAVFSVEVQRGRKLAEGLVKSLTGGDTVAARGLYSKSIEFTPAFKLWLIANDPPEARTDDTAMWRRILRVPFDHVIPKSERDPSIRNEKIRACDVRSAVLAWAVQGCLAWQRGGLRPPKRVTEATEQLRVSMNPLTGFLDDCCILSPECNISAGNLRKAYTEWCAVNGAVSVSTRAASELLESVGCKPARKKSVRMWNGIGLLCDVDDVGNGDG